MSKNYKKLPQNNKISTYYSRSSAIEAQFKRKCDELEKEDEPVRKKLQFEPISRIEPTSNAETSQIDELEQKIRRLEDRLNVEKDETRAATNKYVRLKQKHYDLLGILLKHQKKMSAIEQRKIDIGQKPKAVGRNELDESLAVEDPVNY